MQQVIVELDDATLRRLDKVAPAKARKRSEFIREAIRRALNEALELEMERAYRVHPPSAEEPPFDPDAWEPRRSVAPRRKKRR